MSLLSVISFQILNFLISVGLVCFFLFLIKIYFLEKSNFKVTSLYLNSIFLGIIGARVAYVAQWYEDFFHEPLSVFMISDLGFNIWIGAFVAVSYIVLKINKKKQRYKNRNILIYVFALLLTFLFYQSIVKVKNLLHEPSYLPNLELQLIGSSTNEKVLLDDYLGKPIVVNLWATWCPPCKREMPAFQLAQQELSEIQFVFINQGETPFQIESFLIEDNIKLKNILLDPHSRSSFELQARAYPTTLFYDESGRLVHTHMGEITLPVIKSTILNLFE